MNFSFVLPTLGNPKLVCKFLDSLQRTTKHKNKIEVLFAIDEGKIEIINIVDEMKYAFSIKWFERPKTNDFTNDYYNFLANHSNGKNIIAFNDDAWIRTQDWDEKILRKIKEYNWSIYMVDIPDTARIKYGHLFPCFPCVSRRGMNTLGWLLCEKVRMYPADMATYGIYKDINRVIHIDNVLVEHEHILESDVSKSKMMDIYREDFKNGSIDLRGYSERLEIASRSDGSKKTNKINRIFNILTEK